MRLRPCRVAATLSSLGETAASAAGEQLAKGYPSRAVTDLRQGRPSGLPTPIPLLSVHASENSRRRRNEGPVARPAEVARISGKMWPYFPERAAFDLDATKRAFDL